MWTAKRLIVALTASLGILCASAKDFPCGTCLDISNSRQIAAALTSPTSNWSRGNKRILVLRLEFPDRIEATATEQQCREMMAHADRALRFNSYNTFSLTSTISPVLKFPKPESQFTSVTEIEAVAWQLAVQAGLQREDFDLDVLVGITPIGGHGFAMIGARGLHIKQASTDSVIIHELGHNLGLQHARAWVGTNDSISGLGESREYGDHFDVMGSGARSFNSWARRRLGWLPPESIRLVTTNQTVDIALYETDAAQTNAIHALRVPTADKEFWIDCQLPTSQSPQTADAIIIRWAPPENAAEGTHLLDMRPETLLNTTDASLLLGGTFSDRRRKLHITPVKKLANGFSVQVNFGDFPTNRPPELTLTPPDIINLQVGETFQLSATSADPDGDPVSIAWDFDVGTFGIGPTVTNVFFSHGEYSIVCEASDRKGGRTMKSIIARVGAPTSYRLGGLISRQGRPLPNARVYVSGEENLSARTGPDGRYTLTGIVAGQITLKAAYEGIEISPANFQIPYSVTATHDDLNWRYPEILAFPLSREIPEDAEEVLIELHGRSPTGQMFHNIDEPPKHGYLRGQGPYVFYTPDANYTGPDSFTHYVQDLDYRSPSSTVTIQVQPQPDLPLVFGQPNGRAEITKTIRFPIGDACLGQDGRIYGLAMQSTTNGSDILVRCLDANGNHQWDRILDFEQYDRWLSVLPWNDGVLAHGYTGILQITEIGATLARISSRNEVLWLREYKNAALCIAEPRGNDDVIIAGVEAGSSFVAKIDGATGRDIWRKSSVSGFVPYHIDIGNNGDFAATGRSALGRPMTVKYSAIGDTEWSRAIADIHASLGTEVYMASDRSIYVVSEGSDASVTRYASSGELIWQTDHILTASPLHGIMRRSPMVFDRDEVPHFLAVNAGANWRTTLVRIEGQSPQTIWTSTDADQNFSAALRLTSSGLFQAITCHPDRPINQFDLTTIDPSGAELSSVRLRHTTFDFPKILGDQAGHGFLIIDGGTRFGGLPRLARVFTEEPPLILTVTRGQTITTWPSPIAIDNKPLIVEPNTQSPPQHGTLTGAWPNWTYTPHPNFTGEDRIRFKAFHPGETSIDSEFKIKIIAPLALQSTSNTLTLTADPLLNSILWSKDLKSWTPLRGPTSTRNLDPDSSFKFFRPH